MLSAFGSTNLQRALIGASKGSRGFCERAIRLGKPKQPGDFAGLAPGFTGLYQVNAIVPQGLSPGNEVPLLLTVAGQTSQPVIMAVR